MKNLSLWITRMVLSASFLIIAANAPAATRTVTKVQDTDDGVCDADCSLREAIGAAASGDTINFSSLFNTPQTINLSTTAPYNGGLTISTDLTISGPGAYLLTISSGGEGWSISPVGVNLSGLTITGAAATGIENFGGLTLDACVITGNDGSGIVNHADLTVTRSTISENTGDLAGGIVNHLLLTITKSTVSDNAAADVDPGGGGIYNDFTLNMENSTVSGNSKLGGNANGGGIYHVALDRPAAATIRDSTITNNSADGANSASGLFKEGFGGGVIVGNTIIAANVGNSIRPDVVETFPALVSLGNNVIGNCPPTMFMYLNDLKGNAAAPVDPRLDPLGNYGGLTATHRLQPNSPAVEHGNSNSSEDERGFPRPYDHPNIPNAFGGNGSDTGAYELQYTILVRGGVYNSLDQPLKNVRVLLRSAAGEQRAVKTDRFGIYRFINVARNRNYQVGVANNRLETVPQIWFITATEENIDNLNFTVRP
jgi:CSLREA domain-containing protein